MRVATTAGLTVLIHFAVGAAAQRTAMATRYCEDINNDITIVGETRYNTTSGNDSCYANAYGDGGDELSFTSNITLAGASTSATNLRFFAYAHHLDFIGSDCSNVTFQMVMKYSSTGFS